MDTTDDAKTPFRHQSNGVLRQRKNGQVHQRSLSDRIRNIRWIVDKKENVSEPVQPDIGPLDAKSEWREGRRIVNLGLLADQLSKCMSCTEPLQLKNCSGERRYGLGSILYVNCENCGIENKIYTDTRHRREGTSEKGMQVWDVNTKLGLAMIHTGLGPYHTCNFISTLNIPSINPKNLKEREREVGHSIEECAMESCDHALEEEIKQTVDNGDNNDTGERQIAVTFDGAWQKRGSGKSYNSLTGHATFSGCKTGKCISFGVKSKDCRKCTFSPDEKGDHDCRKNHDGSAKSMESALAVDMYKDLKAKNCTITTIVGDSDSTTISRVNQIAKPKVSKKDDKNHTKKGIKNALFNLQQRFSELTTTVINYLMKLISYAIAQNKENPEALKSNIDRIIPHAFGDHSQCTSEWCGFLSNPGTYQHQSLPQGRDLSGEELFKELKEIFDKYSNDASRLAFLGSSQTNESLNQIISTKAPKSKHFGGSESLNFRVASAVAQKNEGRAYVCKVNLKKGLSPGKFTNIQSQRLDRKRKLEREKEISKTAKRRRAWRKHKNLLNIKAKEIREGKTYSPGVGQTTVKDDDIATIPAPISIEQENGHRAGTSVVFDLETTGFGMDADIVQIAAINRDTQATFSRYILPQKPIHPGASKVTNLYKRNGQLYHGDVVVETTEKTVALREFLDWLPSECILVGHNIKTFDSKLLFKSMAESNLQEKFKEKCSSFADTLIFCNNVYPGRKAEGKCYKQQNLISDITGQTYAAHNALDDVLALSRFLHHVAMDDQLMHPKCVFTISDVAESLEVYRRQRTLTFPSGFISKPLIRKIAASGLEMKHLKMSYERGGREGIESVLSENFKGQTRVTKRKKTLSKISEFFDKR